MGTTGRENPLQLIIAHQPKPATSVAAGSQLQRVLAVVPTHWHLLPHHHPCHLTPHCHITITPPPPPDPSLPPSPPPYPSSPPPYPWTHRHHHPHPYTHPHPLPTFVYTTPVHDSKIPTLYHNLWQISHS